MKMLNGFVAVALGMLVQASHAESFVYSYTFSNGDQVNGTFDGTANGNIVSGLSKISARFNGIDLIGSSGLFGSSWDGTAWVSGGAVASFDGLKSNFIFVDVDLPNNQNWINYFAVAPIITNDDRYATVYKIAKPVVDSYGVEDLKLNPNRWSLVSAVPEPQTYALMLAGLGLMAAVVRRRQQNTSTA